MPWSLLVSLLVLSPAFPAAAVSYPAVIPVTNDGAWITNAILHNATEHAITQRVGSLTYRNGNKTTVVEETYAMQPGEYAAFDDLGAHWDAGDRILQLEPGVTATVFLHFLIGGSASCRPAFELRALTSALVSTGTKMTFDTVRIDDSKDIGAFPTILNTGATTVAMTILAMDGEFTYSEPFSAPPGISQIRIHPQLPNGGKLAIYLGSPGVGTGTLPPVYLFVATGPADGGTQAIRYGE
jgi:hypothetical protein